MARIRKGFRRLRPALVKQAQEKGVSPTQINNWLKLGLNVAELIGKIPVASEAQAAHESAISALEGEEADIFADAAKARAEAKEAPVTLTDFERASAEAEGVLSAEQVMRQGLLKDATIADTSAISAATNKQVRKKLAGRTAAVIAAEREEARRELAQTPTGKTLGFTGTPTPVEPMIRQEDVEQAVEFDAQARALDSAIEGKMEDRIAAIDEQERRALAELKAEVDALRAKGVPDMSKVLAAAPLAKTPEQQERLLQLAAQVVEPQNIKEKTFGVEEKRQAFIKAVGALLPKAPKPLKDTSLVDSARAEKLRAQGEAATTRAEAATTRAEAYTLRGKEKALIEDRVTATKEAVARAKAAYLDEKNATALKIAKLREKAKGTPRKDRTIYKTAARAYQKAVTATEKHVKALRAQMTSLTKDIAKIKAKAPKGILANEREHRARQDASIRILEEEKAEVSGALFDAIAEKEAAVKALNKHLGKK